MGPLSQDIRYGIRAFLKSPGFAFSAVALLAVGIAANVSMFSVASALLFRPLPYPNGERVSVVWAHSDKRHHDRFPVSGPDFVDWQAQTSAFSDMAAFRVRGANLGGTATPERVLLAEVSPSFTRILGSTPQLGRSFLPTEDELAKSKVALISNALWHRALGGSPSAVGSAIRIDGDPYTIVGIMPPRFGLPEDVQIWTPLIIAPISVPDMRASHGLTVIGKLRDGVTVERAQADMNGVTARLEATYPGSNTGWRTRVVSLREQLRGNTSAIFVGLLAAVAAVLLIACGNVANLLMARAAGRRREMWIRTALGAERSRIARQLLTESLLLSSSAGALGVLLSIIGIRLIVALAPATARLADAEPALNVPALAFGLAVSMIVGLLFGVAPAWSSSRVDLASSMREAGRGLTESRRIGRFRNSLASAQIAVSLVLLVSAGLLLRSLDALQRTPTGFSADAQLAFDLSLLGPRYADERVRAATYARIIGELSRLPGIDRTAFVNQLPLEAAQSESNSFLVGGTPEPANGQDMPSAFQRPITAEYFHVMGIPVRRGRSFMASDDASAPLVAIIDEAAAKKYWPDRDPVGRQLMYGRRGGPLVLTIVGIVGSVQHDRYASAPYPTVYVPLAQFPWANATLIVKSGLPATAITRDILRTVHSVDSDLPVVNARTIADVSAGSVSQPRFLSTLLAGFATAALLLAAFGIYSLMTFNVRQRSPELSLRIALGATGADITRLIVGATARIMVVGIVAGALIASLTTRLLASFVFGVSLIDIPTYGAVLGVLSAAMIVSLLVPVFRATQSEPAAVMRDG